MSQGLNPAAVPRERKWQTVLHHNWLYISNTVIEHSTDKPKVECLNPAAGTRREKMVKKSFAAVGLCIDSAVVKTQFINL
jgi:hypothetical protein